MMATKQLFGKHLLKIHLVGGLVCLTIGGSAVYFAGNSISKRRGLFLSARHELASTKSLLNESIKQRSSLASRVQLYENDAQNQLELVSIKMLNARTAEIVELAEAVNIEIDSLQPRDRILDQRVPVQPLDFIGSANADEVFAFLEQMNENMSDIHIQTIDLQSDSIDSSRVQIHMQLYWFIDPADADS